MGRLVNKSELSEILGISQQSLTEWQVEEPPLPIRQLAELNGQANTYDTADVIRWLIDRTLRKACIESPRDRLAVVQAEEVALRIAEKRGLVVSLEQLEPELAQMFGAFRSDLLNRDAKLKAEIDALYGIDINRQFLEDYTRETLNQLARYDPERAGVAAPPGEAARAAGAPDDDAMGEAVPAPVEQGI